MLGYWKQNWYFIATNKDIKVIKYTNKDLKVIKI